MVLHLQACSTFPSHILHHHGHLQLTMIADIQTNWGPEGLPGGYLLEPLACRGLHWVSSACLCHFIEHGLTVLRTCLYVRCFEPMWKHHLARISTAGDHSLTCVSRLKIPCAGGVADINVSTSGLVFFKAATALKWRRLVEMLTLAAPLAQGIFSLLPSFQLLFSALLEVSFSMRSWI